MFLIPLWCCDSCALYLRRFMRPVPRGRFVRWSGRGQGFPVVIVEGKHLFPFRTQQLSPLTPMVLPWRRGGRAGNRRVLFFRRVCSTRVPCPLRAPHSPRSASLSLRSPPCPAHEPHLTFLPVQVERICRSLQRILLRNRRGL